MANRRKTTVDRRESVEYARPFEITLTWVPGAMIAVWMNLKDKNLHDYNLTFNFMMNFYHGNPKQTRISKTLDPMAFDTAMSP